MLKRIIDEFSKNKKSIFWTILFIILFYLILPDKETIESTIQEIKGADLGWIVLGNVFYYITIPLYTIQLIVLSIKHLNNWIAFKVQMSVLFINKLLPSSISSFVINSFYLYKTGHNSSQIASVIAMKAVTSSVTFTLLFIVSILFAVTQFQIDSGLNIGAGNIDWMKVLVFLIIGILIIGFVIYSSDIIKNFIKKSLESFWGQFKAYKERPRDIVWALATSFFAPTLGVLTLLASGRSVDLDINFAQAFLIYTLGTTMANVVPIPGGIGAAEAGLYAGFTFLGFPSAQSMAAVMIYRIITFWIPTIPGFISFINLRKSILKDFSIRWKMPDSKSKKVAKI